MDLGLVCAHLSQMSLSPTRGSFFSVGGKNVYTNKDNA